MQRGDPAAADQLLAEVYEELRRLAAYRMAQERQGHTLQPTALVHEAWLRLTKEGGPQFEGRAHFFAAAGEAMRRILIEAARRKRSLKRGGGTEEEPLPEEGLLQEERSEEMLIVDEALDLLAAKDPTAANLVKLRYFVGMSMEEAATALGMPLRSTERLWAYARAWLRRTIAGTNKR
jgi:RNA polymerase sigma factor (TIGR02999 family)